MANKKLRASGLLLLTAFIWGMAFVAQKQGMEACPPFLFNGVRSILGGFVLLPVIALMDKKNPSPEKTKWPVIGGICCGVALCVASNLQQLGLIGAAVGMSGFITTLYVIFVPVFGIFLKKKISAVTWVSVFIAMGGMYLLCAEGATFVITKSEILLLLCAAVFAVHIMVIDHFAPHVDCVRMSCIQFFVAGILSVVVSLLWEKPDVTSIFAAALPILYTGVLSSGVAYTLQVVAQKDADPTSAALIGSLESVFALLGGWMIMGEKFSGQELWGCTLMFGAIILSQLPILQKKKG